MLGGNNNVIVWCLYAADAAADMTTTYDIINNSDVTTTKEELERSHCTHIPTYTWEHFPISGRLTDLQDFTTYDIQVWSLNYEQKS